jgi:IMP dehydrogenase
VTRRDVRFVENMKALGHSVMTPKERLVTVKEGVDPQTCSWPYCISIELKK